MIKRLFADTRVTWHSVNSASINHGEDAHRPFLGGAPCWHMPLLIGDASCLVSTWDTHYVTTSVLPVGLAGTTVFPRPLLAHYSRQERLRSGEMSLTPGRCFQISSCCMSGCVGWHTCIAHRMYYMRREVSFIPADPCFSPLFIFPSILLTFPILLPYLHYTYFEALICKSEGHWFETR
jgi:hypothetical protein